MPRLRLAHPTGKLRGRLVLPGSKSESNRLLILQALYAEQVQIEGLSTSRDTQVLQTALNSFRDTENLNVGDAGTAMRFMCAFLAMQEGTWVLDGSGRMRERPIGVLVEALRELGADINYLGTDGFPPLKIQGRALKGGLLNINAGISSQYLSALMMVAPLMEAGLEMRWDGEAVSMPYLYLTAQLMRRMGFKVFILGNEIRVPKQSLSQVPERLSVEPDWSAASYWFAAAALAKDAEIYLPGFKEYSLQGDSIVAQLMAPLGVEQVYTGAGIRIHQREGFEFGRTMNLVACPDLAQSLIPAYAAKGRSQKFKGLQTLRIKETNRLEALAHELGKFDCQVSINQTELQLHRGIVPQEQSVATYGDHRMAMGFAAFALLYPLVIEDPEVVEKSYPDFWEHCKSLGFSLEWLPD